jgi:tellurite resistance protein TehA-like permease
MLFMCVWILPPPMLWTLINRIEVPYRSNWLDVIGIVFFLINLTLFLINCVCISIRFRIRPETFIESFTDQVESLFIPSFVSIPVGT